MSAIAAIRRRRPGLTPFRSALVVALTTALVTLVVVVQAGIALAAPLGGTIVVNVRSFTGSVADANNATSVSISSAQCHIAPPTTPWKATTNGTATFVGLPVCTDYVVTEVVPAGYTAPSGAIQSNVHVTPGGVTQVTFTNVRSAPFQTPVPLPTVRPTPTRTPIPTVRTAPTVVPSPTSFAPRTPVATLNPASPTPAPATPLPPRTGSGGEHLTSGGTAPLVGLALAALLLAGSVGVWERRKSKP